MSLCGALDFGRRRLPEGRERSTPVAIVKRHHNDVGDDRIYGSDLNNNSLAQVLCEAVVQHEQACLGSPLHRAHHALDHEDAL